MSRRAYTIQLSCAETGCREWTFSEASTRAEEREIRERYAKRPYRCYRHTRPNDVLSVDNDATTVTLTNVEGRSGRYWDGRNGLLSGPGFRAIAKDFPSGTRLIVTAQIVLPEGGAA